ncbi:ABC transporter substrate-binding protein [Actinomadura decatromicini]|uniref:ABC transporter substrate-binding protein n=1 Tax=Actinomadura decatromicini TaxID=2604572 RepID=A0A5D3FS65_9ACTN|nr:ABC transporter substrate-binding protein [Actinomadura decatromicini]TYK51191.1 ABC transporter substrate-binding protein [Actinomadura decatromicini]
MTRPLGRSRGPLRTTAALSLSLVLAGGLASCGSDGDGSSSGAAGGTLTVLYTQDVAHLDPQRNYVMFAMDFGVRLLYRTLTTYAAKPGQPGTEIVPDLAEDAGKTSDGGQTWTFRLKQGLKYEDGTPITSQDVKYGVERSFAPDLPEGPGYARTMLAGGDRYKGPYKGGSLASIETPDARTVVFHLKEPSMDWPKIATLPTFAPVPKAKDTGVNYDKRPFSSGPYKVESYDRGRRLVLVRNPHWDKATDTVRQGKPDRIVLEEGLAQTAIDQRLIADQGADKRAVTLYSVAAASMPRILTRADVKKRFISATSLCTRFLAMNASKPPFDDPRVRQAMQYAVDKEAYRTAHGGSGVGELAGSYLPPTMTGGKALDVYHAPPNGDPARARQMLTAAGKANGFSVTLTTTSTEQGKAEGEAVQQALARVGVKVRLNPVAKSVYYDAIGDIKKEDELVFYGWCADFPSASSFIPPVFDGRNITPKGNTVVSQYDDRALNEAIGAAVKGGDTAAWQAVDQRIMQASPMVPLIHDKLPLLRGSKVTGAFGHPIWEGEFDFATLGVSE